MLIEQASQHIQHMQKAMSQMNLQLQHVLSDITSETGMKIIRAIVVGERNPKKLASYRNSGCKNSVEIIEKSLTGHYKKEHVFALTQALELYDIYLDKIKKCDQEIEKQLSIFDDRIIESQKPKQNSIKRKSKSHCKNAVSFDVKSHLIRVTGVDLTAIPGINGTTLRHRISDNPMI